MEVHYSQKTRNSAFQVTIMPEQAIFRPQRLNDATNFSLDEDRYFDIGYSAAVTLTTPSEKFSPSKAS